MSADRVIVPIPHVSDADPTHRPSLPSTFVEVDPPTLYLEKIGQMWMRDKGEASPKVSYVLDRLPRGYALYRRPRAGGKMFDSYLFGHPDGKKFDSPNRFFPHFKYLMENQGNRIGCPCTVCNPQGGHLPGSTSAFFKQNSSSSASTVASRPSPVGKASTNNIKVAPSSQKGRSKTIPAGIDTTNVDEEGTPDVFRNLIDKLKRSSNGLDEPITEPLSLDWRAEKEIIPNQLSNLRNNQQWMPRVGDVVLHVRDLDQDLEIARHPVSGSYRVYDLTNNYFLGRPMWEAGLVVQTPADADPDGTRDAQWHVNYAGVRVEPLPNLNDDRKHLSKRHQYVDLKNIRPFCLWHEFMGHIPQQDWHPTIQNALAVSCTVSAMGKYRFRGKWPTATIYMHGIYIGWEALVVGDIVRLLPRPEDPQCHEILVIKSIRIRMSNFDKASSNDYDDGRPYNSEFWVYGSAYTTDPSRSDKQWLDETNNVLPEEFDRYGEWYPKHPPDQELAVPFSRILGRLYEYDMLKNWVPAAHLDCGRQTILDGRDVARTIDRRIASAFGATWFWADSRAEALDLETINGFEVGKHDLSREPSEWRKKIKAMERGSEQPKEHENQDKSGPRNLRDFLMVPTQNDAPLSKQNSYTRDHGGSNLALSSSSSQSVPQKRSLTGESSDEDGDDNQHARAVGKAAPDRPKKSKVMVRID